MMSISTADHHELSTGMTPLTGKSRAAYDADWRAFHLWCQAVEQDPLPASPATILQYVTENPAKWATQARRLAAINRIHLEHGHQPPGADPTVTDAIKRLRPTPAVRPSVPDPAALNQALIRIPLGGWPTGMFGRRDALLLTLRYRAKLSLEQLVALTSDDLHLGQDRQLCVQTSGRVIVLPPTDHPRTCPACIWRRWRTILTLAAGRASNRTLKERLKDPDPTPTTHNCCTPPTGTGPRVALPVFMPIDRWGSLPGIFTPTTTRTAIALAADHLSDRPTAHPAVIDVDEAVDLLVEPESSTGRQPIAARATDYAPIYAAGLAARQLAVAQLRKVDKDLDDVDRAADALNSRILELSDYLTKAASDIAAAVR